MSVQAKNRHLSSIPSNWSIETLGAVLSVCQYGISVGLSQKGEYLVFRMNNIKDGRVVLNDLKYVDIPRNFFDRFKLKKGDLLFNRTNSHDLVGRTGIFQEQGDYTFASYLIRLRCHTDLMSPEYLNYYMNWAPVRAALLALATRGVSQSNINATNLKTLSLAVPPLVEQAYIERILKCVDDAIHACHKTVGTCSALKNGLMQRLLTKGIGHTKFKKTKIGEIPEEWEVVKLQDIFALSYGEGLKGAERETQGKYPVYGSNGIIGFIDEYLVPHKTLIIGRKGACGVVHLTESGSWPIDTTFYVSDLDESRVDIDFLYYSLQFARLSRYTIVTAVPGVNRPTILGHRIALPPLNEQCKIASILSLVGSEISNDEEMIRNLEMLKKGLMQVLLSGKARVKP